MNSREEEQKINKYKVFGYIAVLTILVIVWLVSLGFVVCGSKESFGTLFFISLSIIGCLIGLIRLKGNCEAN